MRINNEAWEKLQNRLSTAEAGPPTSIYLLVHSLTAGADLEASYAESKSDDESTTWRNWAITSTSLVHTEVSFPEANWDGPNEDYSQQQAPDRHVEPSVTQAWVRRLDSVSSLSVGSVGRLSGSGLTKDWFALGDLTLTFEDGSSTTIPGQGRVPRNERDHSDRFISGLRGKLRF